LGIVMVLLYTADTTGEWSKTIGSGYL